MSPMNQRQLKALAGLAVLCGSVYFADDFVEKFGFRALPIGALLILGVCYALVRPPQQPEQQK